MNPGLTSQQSNYKGFLFDIILYLTVMFLIREVYFSQLPFIANGLMWSFSTLIIALWRMKIRNLTWRDLGLRKPDYFLGAAGKNATETVGNILIKMDLN